MIGQLHRNRPRRGRAAVAIAGLALAATLGACGDDDEDISVDDISTDVSDAVSDASDVAATVLDSADDVADTVFDSAEDVVDTMEDAAGSDTTALPDGPPEENPCAAGASGEIGEGEAPADDATAVEVTASEYAFDGFEQVTSTGEYALTLANDGAELHEAVIVRIDDDESRPIEELLQEDDPSEFATDIAFAFACPGETSEPVAMNIDEPGRYVAVCFIPVGTTPETPPEDFETLGPPHALQGMVAEFEVS